MKIQYYEILKANFTYSSNYSEFNIEVNKTVKFPHNGLNGFYGMETNILEDDGGINVGHLMISPTSYEVSEYGHIRKRS